MSYVVDNRGLLERPSEILLVGCGGTGAQVAEGLCRLLAGKPGRILLVDHDRVEPHNLQRQPFYPGDVGRFKAEVLAERLARQYGREIAYSVYPFSKDFDMRTRPGFHPALAIGCVDNPAARMAIASTTRNGYWIDAGNGYDSGQVFIGNAKGKDLEQGFHEKLKLCSRLPLPTVQEPGLLQPSPPAPPRDCAQAVEAGDQSPTINQAMAALVLEFVARLLAGRLTWMAAYLDMETGSLRTVPVEPKAVARVGGVPVGKLMFKGSENGGRSCPNCGRYHA